VLAAASANIAFNRDLVNSSGCLTPGLRVDTILSASAPALSWVLRLAACDRASGPNELAWRRPRYGYTQDDARSELSPNFGDGRAGQAAAGMG
jgi:hypothetical protein